jgi:hypothetical protein
MWLLFGRASVSCLFWFPLNHCLANLSMAPGLLDCRQGNLHPFKTPHFEASVSARFSHSLSFHLILNVTTNRPQLCRLFVALGCSISGTFVCAHEKMQLSKMRYVAGKRVNFRCRDVLGLSATVIRHDSLSCRMSSATWPITSSNRTSHRGALPQSTKLGAMLT